MFFFQMNTVQLKNPWEVESIQDFSCLKCPECVFFTKEENDFENHAVANHPLSAMLFDGTISSGEIEDAEKEEVLEDINNYLVYNIKKEPADLDSSEKDPFDFSNADIQRQGTHFMSSLAEPDSLDNDYLLHPRNKAKKLKIEPRSDYFSPHTSANLGKKQVLCIFCNRDYKNWSNRNRHMKICKKKPSDVQSNPETISLDSELQNENKLVEKNFQCPKCSFKTSQKHYLDQHINGHNDCQYCGKVFLGSHGKAKLATHVKTHQVVKYLSH